MATEVEQSSSLGENGGGEECGVLEQAVIERRNLLNLVKLTVKVLIESTMRTGRPLDDTDTHLQQLFTALEHSLRHRLKVKRNLLGQRRSYWAVVEGFEKSSSDFMETVINTRSLIGIKTTLGRGRAWLRMSLMEKKLADHFRIISENKLLTSEFYESDGLMMSEECTVIISGLLMGLNVIDYSLSMKGEDFDRAIAVIDLSAFLKDGNYLEKPPDIENETEVSEEFKSNQLSQLLDQKAYLEELNKKLEGQVNRLQKKCQSLEGENNSVKEQLGGLIDSVETLTSERDNLKDQKDHAETEMIKKLETTQDDQKIEIDTYVQSRAGLNELYATSQKNLDVEMKLRQHLEQEIEVMRRLKEENETALQLLEKSVHEKQDTIVTLRKQLEEMKGANLKIKSQLKVAKETHHADSLSIRNLEAKVSQLSTENRQLETSLNDTKSSLREADRTAREIGEKLQEIQLARNTAESDLAVEKQWRASLQMELQREKDRVVELTNETKRFKSLKQEYAQLQEKYACVQETISEQEIGLVEMGKQLSLSQQKLADMKVVSQVMTESVWQEDRDILVCQSCESAFSVAKRKHHCRNCGGVFCGSCSDNTMQLASSAKPVRVCDNCYQLLLERSSK